MNHEGGGSGQAELADMSASDALTFAEAQHAERLQAERNILEAAYQWAVLHPPDRLPEADKRDRERAKPAGAAGTPLITEYAAATFGARIQTSPYGTRKLIAEAADLHHRLPKLDAGINAGTARVGHARHVAEATRDLSSEQAAERDAITPPAVARAAAARIPRATVRAYDCGHFDPYVAPLFDTVVADQLAFLAEHVPISTIRR